MGITSTASGNVKATQDYSTIRYSYQRVDFQQSSSHGFNAMLLKPQIHWLNG